ncbi:MAG: hypothetical protein D6781_06175 [Verrucomicrobia bacterium]|nr:MAG: hypothetical protein D6781_06175 [Verrucomicrobiota bacterium]
MNRIEVTLNLSVVAPLLDFIQPILRTLEAETAFGPGMEEADRELEHVWREGLIHTQVDDCAKLMALFDAEFFESGRVVLEPEHADAILRAAAAIRLKLRETALKDMSDATLEAGDVELSDLSEEERTGFAAYLFLATLQEIIIQHMGL